MYLISKYTFVTGYVLFRKKWPTSSFSYRWKYSLTNRKDIWHIASGYHAKEQNKEILLQALSTKRGSLNVLNGFQDVLACPFPLSNPRNQSSPSLLVKLPELLCSLLGIRYKWRCDSWLGRGPEFEPIVCLMEDVVLSFFRCPGGDFFSSCLELGRSNVVVTTPILLVGPAVDPFLSFITMALRESKFSYRGTCST